MRHCVRSAPVDSTRPRSTTSATSWVWPSRRSSTGSPRSRPCSTPPSPAVPPSSPTRSIDRSNGHRVTRIGPKSCCAPPFASPCAAPNCWVCVREVSRLGEGRAADLRARLGPLVDRAQAALVREMNAGTVRRADPAHLLLFTYSMVDRGRDRHRSPTRVGHRRIDLIARPVAARVARRSCARVLSPDRCVGVAVV